MVGYGVLSHEWSRFIAPTLTEAVDAVIAGECFHDKPTIGEKRRTRG